MTVLASTAHSRLQPRPLVSVVLAAHNSEAFIRESVGSLLAQTLRTLEVIVVDDGSADCTARLALSFGDPRVRLISMPKNLGQTRALNIGIRAAGGEFIARQDADDLSYPERLAMQATFMQRNPDVALVGSYARVVDAGGRGIGTLENPTSALLLRWRLLFQNALVHPTWFWRRHVVAQVVGEYDEAYEFANDYEFVTRVAQVLQVRNLATPLLDYRRHAAAMGVLGCEDEQRAAACVSMREIGRLYGDRVGRRAIRAVMLGWTDQLATEDLHEGINGCIDLHRAFLRFWRRRDRLRSGEVAAVLADLESHMRRARRTIASRAAGKPPGGLSSAALSSARAMLPLGLTGSAR